jgi:hypothetical protein
MGSKKAEIDKEILKTSLIRLSKEEPEFMLLVIENSTQEAFNKINEIYQKLNMVVKDLNSNPLLNGEIHDMEDFKNKHRIQKDVIEQLQELWKDEPPAEEIIKQL